MDNRQPTPGMEGRVLIIPENGSAPFYARMTMADKPLVEGTPWAKESIWPDDVAALLGLGVESLPKDGFKKLQQLLQQAQTDIENGVEIITGSYIGTGTYGKDNPNSLRFERKPMLVALLYLFYSNGTFQAIFSNSTNKIVSCMYLDSLSEDYKENAGFNASASYYNSFGKKSADGKTIYWYAEQDAIGQYNTADAEYHYMAICI